MDFVVLADNGLKIKASEKIDKYLDIDSELWNEKVTMILIVVGAF